MKFTFFASIVILSQISIVNAESNLQGGKNKIAVVPPPNFYLTLFSFKNERGLTKYRDKPSPLTRPVRHFSFDSAKFVHYRTYLADNKTIEKFKPPKGKPPTFFVGGKRVKSNIYMDGKWGRARVSPPPRK